MLVEDLHVLAAARGIDLQQASRLATKQRRDEEMRYRKMYGAKGSVGQLIDRQREAEAGRGKPISDAKGRATHSMREREWSLAELGQAAQGVPDVCFMAACFAYAGSSAYFWTLHAKLYEEALRIALREEWPRRIKDHHGIEREYIEHLAKLVLDEEQHHYSVRWPGIASTVYAIYMGFDELVWKRSLGWRFLKLQFVWHDWIGTAASIMQPRLAADSV